MQQQLAMMQQMMLHQMALAQQPHNKTKYTAKKRKLNQMKYCWTHGACNHMSPECRSKADGYQVLATFQDRKGCSTKNIE